ncbi:helix-turn-helix transcriptional regulator [Micromonospora sp. WMMD1102]|uniref:helix-turn-helix domain-containing protein n=1 Tax=Micromonospora sp. WMMD1102 TaxID=3016105 RepID=UPI0024156ED1|nr:helix-turn-helix transcriptional regulator [Micromonospora sp. WMMD1102]MDG4791881.1 helix-turn-helix transcriptional regulator [Micromonospora sp. WMMD1102]
MTRPQTLAVTAAAEVRAEMGRQRISAAALARALGVSDMYLSRRLSGDDPIPFDLSEIERIAEALGVPVGNFLPSLTRAAASTADAA